MKIFVSGDDQRIQELEKIIRAPHELFFAIEEIDSADILIDLNFDDANSSEGIPTGKNYSVGNKFVIGCAVKKNLKQLNPENKFRLIGMNLIPTFINRSKQEMSFANEEDEKSFSSIAQELQWNVLKVEDKIGMVTPRVIAQLINEACYSLEKGVATIQDIDKGMKLGTAYPMGPFEWCNKIGVKNVYQILLAIFKDTKDERFKISSLLEKQASENKPFLL